MKPQPEDADVFDRALRHACEGHDGSRDKSGLPYILHPMAVALAVAQHGLRAQAVALLHDVMEDTEYDSHHSIWLTYPSWLTAAVEALTHRPNEPYDAYLFRVAQNELAAIVKQADMEHNSSPERLALLPEAERERLRAKYTNGLRVLRGLLEPIP